MSKDDALPYTYKSQYLQHISLTGDLASGIKGNALSNQLNGNNADNTIEAMGGDDQINCKGGNDKVIYSGNFAEYTFSSDGVSLSVQDNTPDRDGNDTVRECEILQFADQEVAAADLSIHTSEIATQIQIFPNPVSDIIQIQNNSTLSVLDFKLYDSRGKLILSESIQESLFVLPIYKFAKGIYILEIEGEQKELIKREKLIFQ